MEYSGAGGKRMHGKNQKQKISWHCPFKIGLYPQYIIESPDQEFWKQAFSGLRLECYMLKMFLLCLPRKECGGMRNSNIS